MTDNKFGSDKMEMGTFNFRNAIVKYLMHIHGLHDTYFKQEKVNTYMDKVHKVYVKKAMCAPDLLTKVDFDGMQRLTPEQKCHMCLLVMETKIRVELIYVTKALGQLLHL